MELANIEARVIIAMLVRRYEFIKVGLGQTELDGSGQPIVDNKGQFKVKSDLYSVSLRSLHTVRRKSQVLTLSSQTIRITAKPVDGMMMKVKSLGI